MGAIRQAYLAWKALRLPWRKDVLAGTDLDGNLYFERSLQAGAQRTRRHVIYNRNITVAEYSDQIIPIQWQAWMRHTRSQPPTIQELLRDVERRRRMAENVHRLAAKDKSRIGAVAGPEPRSAAQKAYSPPGAAFEPEDWTPTSASRRKDKEDGNRPS
ncbi:hypothetical protein GGF44_005108 [Coemansia sp. RSA 1694]|nr:hypothetical protein IWW47_000314 [Coemansia sp. RSA 2052]KAJ2584731.1 hypothetical protein GGH95_000175 [Coemansia sp. RSA 1836]KAJ2626232.1 hypothetical protein GGF44_005108 [Coemansia sp. RSA 1694]